MFVPFENNNRKELSRLLEQVFDSGFLSEGEMLRRFEYDFGVFCGLPSAAVSSGGAALLALYEYAGVRGKDVVVPANTFWASAAAAKLAGAKVIYADCNRDDLCLSLTDLKKKVTPETRAVCVVHIGGHIAFEIEEIAAFCRERNIALIEDCAHAHGASWKDETPGSWGLGGAYSFYATKTMPLGDGGMVVSRDENFLDWVRHWRNYGKEVRNGVVSYPIANGFNYRMNELTAALGIVQTARMPMILSWKKALAEKFDQIFENRILFPNGMSSGYYKYIVFDTPLNEETGKVFNHTDFGNEIEGVPADLPNSYWIAEHHRCAPIWYGWPHADEGIESLKVRLKTG